MYSLTNQKIPENLNITVSKDNVTEDFKVTPEDEKKLEKSIAMASKKKSRRHFLYETLAKFEDGTMMRFARLKDLFVYCTGKQPWRACVPEGQRTWINKNLLPGIKPVANLYRTDSKTHKLIEF